MSTINYQLKKYPLLPFSQLVYEMTGWWSSIYRQRLTFRVKEGADSLDKWRMAIETAFRNHPVFSSRIDKQAQQYAQSTEHILEGKYYQVALQKQGDDLVIMGQISRILGDGKSLAILMDDIRRAYQGEKIPTDDYWGYLEYIEQQKHLQHYADSKEWLIREFADESIPVRPSLDRRLWTLFPPKAGVYQADYTDVHQSIYQFAKEHIISLDGFFSLCTALAIAEYCGTDVAALTWAYEGRERPEEQRVYGSLHKDVPFQLHRSDNRDELIKNTRNQIRQGIAHSDYPYTLTAPYNKRWNYAVNVLRVEDEHELIKLLPQPIELLPTPPQKYAYALLDVEIHESFEALSIVYRYSATHYKPESIRRFASLVRKYAEWLLEE